MADLPFSSSDLQRVGEILARAAETEIMPRFGQLGANQVRWKTSALDLVTDADLAAEKAITRSLLEVFPGAQVIGEESSYKEPKLLESIGTADLMFVVDPIDGTKNFACHLPLFGVMCAAIMRGEVVASVIFDPVYREWAYALSGKGAWIEREDGLRASLVVASPVELAQMEGIGSTSFLPEPLRSTVNGNLRKVLAMNS